MFELSGEQVRGVSGIQLFVVVGILGREFRRLGCTRDPHYLGLGALPSRRKKKIYLVQLSVLNHLAHGRRRRRFSTFNVFEQSSSRRNGVSPCRCGV